MAKSLLRVRDGLDSALQNLRQPQRFLIIAPTGTRMPLKMWPSCAHSHNCEIPVSGRSGHLSFRSDLVERGGPVMGRSGQTEAPNGQTTWCWAGDKRAHHSAHSVPFHSIPQQSLIPRGRQGILNHPYPRTPEGVTGPAASRDGQRELWIIHSSSPAVDHSIILGKRSSWRVQQTFHL